MKMHHRQWNRAAGAASKGMSSEARLQLRLNSLRAGIAWSCADCPATLSWPPLPASSYGLEGALAGASVCLLWCQHHCCAAEAAEYVDYDVSNGAFCCHMHVAGEPAITVAAEDVACSVLLDQTIGDELWRTFLAVATCQCCCALLTVVDQSDSVEITLLGESMACPSCGALGGPGQYSGLGDQVMRL